MAIGMIYEGAGLDESGYRRVVHVLVDHPDGRLIHAAGPADDGHWVIIEVWTSPEAAHAYIATSLTSAFAATGVQILPPRTFNVERLIAN